MLERFLLNANPQVWQRGNSIINLQAGFVADRWYFRDSDSLARACTVEKVANIFWRGASDIMRIGRTPGTTLVGVKSLHQVLPSIESRKLSNGQVKFAPVLSAGANFSAAAGAVELRIIGSLGGYDQQSHQLGAWTSEVVLATQTVNVTPGAPPQAFPILANVPANCTQLAVFLKYTPIGTAGADDALYIHDVEDAPPKSYGASLMECAEFYEEKCGIDNSYPVVLSNMYITPTVSGWTQCNGVVSYQRKRFYKRADYIFSPSMATDYHLAPATAGPIYNLVLAMMWPHRGPDSNFITARYQGNMPAGYIAGLPILLATDGSNCMKHTFAIDADL
jgi:hypothetical protein